MRLEAEESGRKRILTASPSPATQRCVLTHVQTSSYTRGTALKKIVEEALGLPPPLPQPQGLGGLPEQKEGSPTLYAPRVTLYHLLSLSHTHSLSINLILPPGSLLPSPSLPSPL